MPIPADSEVLPLLLLELALLVESVVDSLMAMVRISPTSCAFRSEKIFRYRPPSAQRDCAETATGATLRNSPPAASAKAILL